MEIKDDIKYTKVLDHGFVGLVDIMGTDASIDQAARVSYGKGTRSVNDYRGLIRYLKRHKHTTPFEMVEVKFHCKMPIFVARQWIRHRTANVNEYSARYSILDADFYLPEDEHMAEQSHANNQGRNEKEPMDKKWATELKAQIKALSRNAYTVYRYLLNDSGEKENGLSVPQDPNRPMLARELARMVLPVNYYTQWYWKIDLHNLMHFLQLRMDEHAQYEVRVYAQAMYDIVKEHVPEAIEAFEEYQLKAETFSRTEVEYLRDILQGSEHSTEELKARGLSIREINEFKRKLTIR